MEFASIERQIHVEAAPEVVFEVISRPEHIRDWWYAECDVQPTPGATGELAWADGDNPRAHVTPMTVVASDPPRLFSFRWTHPAGEAAVDGNSLLVTFELVASGSGTLLRLTETGFRERGWEIAVLEQQYHEHVTGWGIYVPRIGEHAERLVSAR
ncbi:SRPBCC domain-containing protein [Frankia sp. CNm7]|uniref:SRPBCC domain-containing protein n=1 Tax=Frankia nepalensis TaxID=1836974 RepID=A0A937RG58_9ACTN|nr:SRPBCC domain-containing protein [Frankia nepalensis]MBL7497101.1 SRPBCC domain-containing protein [Frankia nepalensis]MBL7510773.1 SRPBCC domain-containing protein [Frankia nepalensis]MBL7521549.1 SRPBCC domain-containing protein [Frankia nepalensis]MBL7626784.1 SRPBCC domain-containing protein [Frankia nepalensis]